jgi:hypothetical protein
MATLFFLLAVGFACLTQTRRLSARAAFSALFIISAALTVLYFIADDFLVDSRLYSVFSIVADNPFLLFELDASSNARLSSIVLPLQSFFENYFLPHGFYDYPIVAERVASFYGNFFFYEYDKAKIESWIGSLLFELGIFGLMGLIAIFRMILIGDRRRIAPSFFFLLILFSAIPTGFPLVYLLTVFFIIKGSSANKIEFWSRKSVLHA